MVQRVLRLSVASIVGVISLMSISHALAVSAPSLAVPAGLSIAEIKITGNEFIMLQNNTGGAITDLSRYWLYSFNNVNPLTAGTTNSSQQLPVASLSSGQTLLLSSTGGATCGAAATDKLSIGLGDFGGYLEVVKVDLINNVLQQVAGDVVSWSSAANTAVGMISKVPSNTTDPGGAWYRYHNSSATPPFVWQQAELNPKNSCQLDAVIAGATVSSPTNLGNQLLPSLPPPATIVSLASPITKSKLPPVDVGLRSPQLTELLPNPASPQTDDKDEFVEIYNSNNASFDLSGFKLQFASSAKAVKHTYTFPGGTFVAAKSFAAYPSSNISVSLTNSSGIVWLLDPNDIVISQTQTYSTAKDGQAWALADGKWYWTGTPTAGGSNVINNTNQKKSSSGSGVGTVKGVSTIAGPTTGSTDSSKPNETTEAKSINSAVLVAVGALAVVYGLYEYRRDLANVVQKFKRHRATRRENRPKY